MARFKWKSLPQLEQEETDRAWEVLRLERDQRLRDSDWTQLPDAPFDPQARGKWVQYRRDLRNLPDVVDNPRNPNWPEKPE